MAVVISSAAQIGPILRRRSGGGKLRGRGTALPHKLWRGSLPPTLVLLRALPRFSESGARSSTGANQAWSLGARGVVAGGC